MAKSVTKIQSIFIKKLDLYRGTLAASQKQEKSKNFKNFKITKSKSEKVLGYPPLFTQKFCPQNDTEWLEIDFKHNINIKTCKILTHQMDFQLYKM